MFFDTHTGRLQVTKYGAACAEEESVFSNSHSEDNRDSDRCVHLDYCYDWLVHIMYFVHKEQHVSM